MTGSELICYNENEFSIFDEDLTLLNKVEWMSAVNLNGEWTNKFLSVHFMYEWNLYAETTSDFFLFNWSG